MSSGKTKIFIDTSSCLMKTSATVIAGPLLEAVKKSGSPLFIQDRVHQELEKHADGDKPGLARLARSSMQVLARAQVQGLVTVVGADVDQFADAMFQTIFSGLRTKYNLTLVTQDVALMMDVLDLGSSKSITNGMHSIEVWTIDEFDGQFRQVFRDEARRRHSAQLRRKTTVNKGLASNDAIPRYEMGKAPVTRQTPIKVAVGTPGSGDTVKSGSGKKIVLGALVGAGGEGRVFRTSESGLVAKIYNQKFLTKERQAKLQLMAERGLDFSQQPAGSVCWPRELLFDGDGIFRGYLMREARGQVLANAVMIGSELTARFPEWDRVNLVEMCLSLVRTIHFLHQSNILIGDINPNNIMIAGEKEVYFIDADSFQIENWPCPVGTAHFTAREIQGRPYTSFLRTREHERFAVATLLFMVMHAGKQPYAQRNHDSFNDNLNQGRFPYPFKGRSTDTAPRGPWRFIWSNLTYKMKEVFFRSFDASHFDERRVKLEEWIEVLESYKYHLKNDCGPGHIERQLLPSSFKPLSNHAARKFKQTTTQWTRAWGTSH